MSEQILVNVTGDEVRIAFLSGGHVREISIERQSHPTLTGNIYCGRVRRLLPGLGAIFVEVGLSRPGFLHETDILPKAFGISGPLKVGSLLPVQVSRDPLGSKGPRLVTRFSLPGHFLVLTPDDFRVAVSQKIVVMGKENPESARLLSLIKPSRYGGYIIRTAAQGVSLDLLLAEQQRLDQLWEGIQSRFASATPPECLYAAPPIFLRLLRDRVGDPQNSKKTEILVDDPAIFEIMRTYAAEWFPDIHGQIHFYDSTEPLFALGETEKTLKQALERRVPLKSGGHVVFDQTEAMVTIDVNSGSSLAIRRAADALFRTNLEAVEVIAREVRLRNLGGIIIIDFIDLPEPQLQAELLESLKKAFADDTVQTTFSELTRLGLVQMTRKRTGRSLLHSLCDPCPLCKQSGVISSVETVAHDILRALKLRAAAAGNGFRVQLSPEVADYLLKEESLMLSVLETQFSTKVELCGDARYGRDSWDILPCSRG